MIQQGSFFHHQGYIDLNGFSDRNHQWSGLFILKWQKIEKSHMKIPCHFVSRNDQGILCTSFACFHQPRATVASWGFRVPL